MIERRVDLHIHTCASDGQQTAREVVELALQRQLAAISITDHDSVAAIDEAIEAARGSDLEIIPGVELGVDHDGADVHLLGYLIDHTAPGFLQELKRFQRGRFRRGEKIVSKLNELGVDLAMDTVLAIAGEAPLGRPHVADAMVREEYVDSYREAFARYLGYHAPAYVPRTGLSAQEAIELIHSVDGVAVLAHPGILNRDDLVPLLVELGLDGLEAFHYRHDEQTARHYVLLAHHHGLLYTGGSDCHGHRSGQGSLLGRAPVPYQCVTALKKRQGWLQWRSYGPAEGDQT
jgi:predicted metal-dependent phosphoesterase TrpH